MTDPATPSNLAGFGGPSSAAASFRLAEEPIALKTYARNSPKARIYINVVLEKK
jgi:hypothetical protein